MIPTLLAAAVLGSGGVDLTLTPSQCVPVGFVAEVDLVLSADMATSVSAVDVILSWDPAELELLTPVPIGSWLATGFLTDPDGINSSTADGDALYTLLSLPQSLLSVDPSVAVVTFRFLVLDDGGVEMLPSLGLFGETKVVGAAPGEIITGDVGGPIGVGSMMVPALEFSRLGVPPNPDALKPGVTSGPILGAVWDPVIDHTTFMPAACLDFLVLSVTPVNVPTVEYGTALCISVFAQFPIAAGVPYSIFIPPDCSLIGAVVCSQGASFDCGSTLTLTNAIDFKIGNI